MTPMSCMALFPYFHFTVFSVVTTLHSGPSKANCTYSVPMSKFDFLKFPKSNSKCMILLVLSNYRIPWWFLIIFKYFPPISKNLKFYFIRDAILRKKIIIWKPSKNGFWFWIFHWGFRPILRRFYIKLSAL